MARQPERAEATEVEAPQFAPGLGQELRLLGCRDPVAVPGDRSGMGERVASVLGREWEGIAKPRRARYAPSIRRFAPPSGPALLESNGHSPPIADRHESGPASLPFESMREPSRSHPD